MPKLTENQKSLVILGGGLLLAVGFGVMTYLHWTKAGEIEAEIVRKKAERDKNDKEILRTKPLKHEFVAYGQIVQNNSKILPTAAVVHEFIRDLGNLEKETGITVKTLPKYDEGKSVVPNISKIPMKLTLGSSTRNLLRFMNQLENRERLITITDFRIAPTTAEAKPGQENEHDVSMTFEVYRYQPPQGAAEEPLVTDAERTLLLDQAEVKKILEQEGKPTLLERYDLMRTREDRRDLFTDPRRRLTGTGVDVTQDDIYTKESTQYAFLELKYRKAKVEYDAFRNVESSPDFLLRAAQKKAFLQAMESLEGEIKKVSARSPEFQSRDIQDKYVLNVKRPYEKLKNDAQDILSNEVTVGDKGPKITEEIARGLRQELQALVDARKFPEASERWQNIDLAFRDAGKRVEEGAKAHHEAMKALGERARYQKLFAEKKMDILGVVRMQKPPSPDADPNEPPAAPEMVSAIIVSTPGTKDVGSRILTPGKTLDRDVQFRGVEEGGRLLFSFQGHEVDYVPPPPDLLTLKRDILTSE